jgi:hypothetical protein
MPAKSKAQQKFMGMVHAAQKGEKAASTKVAKVAKRMKKKDAEDYASTKHKGLPRKVKKEDLMRLISKYGAKRVKETIMAVSPKSDKGYREPEKPNFEYDPDGVDEGFGGELKGKDKEEFEKARKENAEVLGYEATGTSDTKKQTMKMAHQLKENKAELYKMYTKAMKMMPGTSKQKQLIKKIDALRKKLGMNEERDYKAEYKKFQSSTKSKKYRAELNQYNRKKGTYGNGDGKDASHKGGKIAGFEKESTNRGRAEKSRLKKEMSNPTSGIMSAGRMGVGHKYSSREAQIHVDKDLGTMSKFLGKASQQVIKTMMDGVKSGKYDAMDLARGIQTGPIKITHYGERDFIQQLWTKVRDKFRKYSKRGKLR